MINKILVTNLNDLYEKVRDINLLSKEASDLHCQLDKIILDLSNCWQGSDANVHYKHLLGISEWLFALSYHVLELSELADQNLRKLVEKQRANGGAPPEFPKLQISAQDDFRSTVLNHRDFERYLDTLDFKMFVDIFAARPHFERFSMLQGLFEDFTAKFSKYSNYMLEVWKSGECREIVKQHILEFQKKIEQFNQLFAEAVGFLESCLSVYETY